MSKIFYKEYAIPIQGYLTEMFWEGNQQAKRHTVVVGGVRYHAVSYPNKTPSDVEALDSICEQIVAEMAKR